MPDRTLQEFVSRKFEDVRAHLSALGRGDANQWPDLSSLVEGLNRLALQNPLEAANVGNLLWTAAPESPEVRASIQAARANVMCYASNPVEAARLLAEAEVLGKQVTSSASRARLHHAAIQPLARLGRINEAAQAATSAFTHYTEAGEVARAARIRMNLGILTRMQGHAAESLEHFNAARIGLGEDTLALGALESNRAEALLDLSRFADAEQAWTLALQHFETTQNSHGAAIVEGNLAELLAREGRVVDALHRFERARRVFERSNAHGDVARLSVEEAEFLASIGAIQEAASVFRVSLPELERAGLQREHARGLHSFARLALGHGEHESGLAMLDQAVTLWSQIGDDVSKAESELLRAAVEGESDHATLLALVQQLQSRPAKQVIAMLDLIERNWRRGDFETARVWIDLASQALSHSPLRSLKARYAHNLARMSKSLGDSQGANSQFRVALAHAQSVEALLPAGHLESGLSSAWDALYSEACIASLDGHAITSVSEAFEAMELMRSRSLMRATDLFGKGLALTDDCHILTQRYSECLGELRAAYSLTSDPRPGSKMHAPNLLRRIDELEAEASGLRRRISAMSGAKTALVSPLSFEHAQSELSPSTAVVYYFDDGDSYGSLVMLRGSFLVVRRICSRREVQRLNKRLAFEISMRSNASRFEATEAAVRELSSRLGELLWRPIQSLLAQTTDVCIVPVGELANVAWACVRVQGEYLAERHSLSVLPSVSAGVHLREKRRSIKLHESLLCVGVADDAAPKALEEINAICAAISNSQTLVGAAATSARVCKAMSKAHFVHMACHGVHAPGYPMSSRIKMWDRWLTARELADSILPGTILSLSACESARVGVEDPDAVPGIVRAALAGGASSVLAGRWPLGDRAARKMFPDLIAKVSSGQECGFALAHAQRDWMRNSVSLLDWGGLVVTGGLP